MTASIVDPNLVYQALDAEIAFMPLENNRTDEILKNMRKVGIRRYGHLVQRSPLHVGVLVGREAFEQLVAQLACLAESNLPIMFGMDTKEYGWKY